MLDLFKKVLPSSIEVDGETFFIHTEFNYWIEFSKRLKTSQNLLDFDFVYINQNKIPFDRNKGLEQLIKFAFPPKPLPRPTGDVDESVVAYDYSLDADLIFAAFMKQYKIDLLDSNMHWYKFVALFDSLENTLFSQIISYRVYNPNSKYDDKKFRLKMKEAWKIEKELTESEEEAIAEWERKNNIR